MGRAFEYRKATKLKRWGNMARVFTKLGKQITIAAKDGGGDPDTNPRLRVLMLQAKKENMPKENVERAIKRAFSKDESDYKEMNYEGYAPHGIALFIETTTDNTTRTVANIRSYFTKNGGSLGTSGCVEFMFEHKCIFRVESKEGISLDDLELELIDCGIDGIDVEDNELVIFADFAQNSAVQKYLEDNNFEINSSEFVRIPTEYKELPTDQRESVMKLIEKIEDDEDVQNVYHNMKVDEE